MGEREKIVVRLAIIAAMASQPRRGSCTDQPGATGLRSDPFISVNERPVDDISLEFFYRPHTVTLLAVSIISMMYFAYVR